MAATLRAYVDGDPVVLRGRTLAIEKSANQRATLSGSVYVEPGGAVPTVRDRIGITKDIDPGSRSFDGSTSVLSRAFSSGITDDWTIGIWAYVTATGSQRFLFQVGDASDGYGVYITSTGYWQGVLSGAAAIGGTASAVVTNTWTHVAASVRRNGLDVEPNEWGATVDWYVNGALVNSEVGTGGTGATGPRIPRPSLYPPPRIVTALGGAYSNTVRTFTNGFDGAADDLVLYPRALSAAEVATLYASGPFGLRV